jgi:hypothetical protein
MEQIYALARIRNQKFMKLHHLFIVSAMLLALPACEREQPTAKKVKNTVNDALDQRPGEKIKDAIEDTEDAVKEASEDIKDAVKDAAK